MTCGPNPFWPALHRGRQALSTEVLANQNVVTRGRAANPTGTQYPVECSAPVKHRR